MRTTRTIAAGLILLTALIAACGWGGPPSTTSAPPQSTSVERSRPEPTVAPIAQVPAEATETGQTPGDGTGGALATRPEPTPPTDEDRGDDAQTPVAQEDGDAEPTATATRRSESPTAGSVGDQPDRRRATTEPVTTEGRRSTAPSPTPEPAKPVRLKIDTDDVEVDAPIEHVAYAPNSRAMDVPKEWENVAWFEPGYEPGKKGNAVIAGHLDTDNPNSPCAVFCYLDRIDVGDSVTVEDEEGKALAFRVTKVAVYEADEAPLREIFGPSEKPRLNLITCDGTWNREARQYDKRLVVFTEKAG